MHTTKGCFQDPKPHLSILTSHQTATQKENEKKTLHKHSTPPVLFIPSQPPQPIPFLPSPNPPQTQHLPSSSLPARTPRDKTARHHQRSQSPTQAPGQSSASPVRFKTALAWHLYSCIAALPTENFSFSSLSPCFRDLAQ